MSYCGHRGDLTVDTRGTLPDVPVVVSYASGPAMRGTRMKVRSGPTLLAAVALLLLVLGARSGESVLRMQEFALAVVLGVLAVLPIRQVTVPGDLEGLTRVDVLLAFGVVAVGVVAAVGVLLLALALQLWSGNGAFPQQSRGEGR